MDEKKTKRRTRKKETDLEVTAVIETPSEAADISDETKEPETFKGIVSTKKSEYLNIRKSPDLNSAIVAKAKVKTVLELKSEPVNGFYQLADELGFVKADLIKK